MLITLYIVSFLATFSDGFLVPVTPLYAATLGASVSQVGFIVAVYSYVAALLLIPSGKLSDRVGPEKFLVMSLVVFALGPLLYGLVAKAEQLILVRTFYGLAPAFFSPTGLVLAVGLAPGEKKGEALGWYTMALHLGHMSGPITGGFVFTQFGFHAAFYGCSAIAVLGLVLVLIRIDTFRVQQAARVTEGSIWNWLKQRPVLGCLLAQFVMGFGMGNIAAYLPLYCQTIGVAGVGAGVVITVLFACSSISRGPAGRLSDRIGGKPLVLAGVIITTLAVAFISQFESLSYLVLTGIFFGLGMGIASTALFALSAEASSAELMGLSMGITAFCFHLGLAAGPTSLGHVAEATSFGTMYLMSAAISAIGLFAIAGLLRFRQSYGSADPTPQTPQTPCGVS